MAHVKATGLRTALWRCDLSAELPHLAGSGLSRPSPALFMTVRRESAESRGETGARSREDPTRTRAVR